MQNVSLNSYSFIFHIKEKVLFKSLSKTRCVYEGYVTNI